MGNSGFTINKAASRIYQREDNIYSQKVIKTILKQYIDECKKELFKGKDSVKIFSQNHLPFGIRQSAGYAIRLLLILHMDEMIHVHVSPCTPLGSRYMAQSGTYEHQSTLSIRKGSDGFCASFDLSV